MPSEVRLHWAKTQYTEGRGIEFTGEMQSFEARIGLEELLAFSARVRLAWDGIKTLSALHTQAGL